MAEIKPTRLIMVTGENNNKWYSMTPNTTTFLVEFGRVGGGSQTATYPISQWNKKYNEKVKKGYKDVTELVAKTVTKSSNGHAEIGDLEVRALFDKLMGYSKVSVQQNYTISSDAVSSAQVKEAQAFVDELTKIAEIGAKKDKVNKLLLDLYTVIPRKMKQVQTHLIQVATIKKADDLDILRNIIDTEQKTLDVMAGQVSMRGVVDTDDTDDSVTTTILDALGITVEVGNADDEKIVKKLMGPDAREFRKVYRVSHPVSRKIYTKHVDGATNKKSELFWHGSRNENWISILQTGLKIRPSNAIISGAMFGHGIYFADKYRKSANYTSLRGSYWAKGSQSTAFLSLLDVHLGKQFEIMRHNHECYNYNKAVMQQKGGYDSVFAKGGADLINNEYIVYDDAQSTINYLIEVGN